MKLELTFPLTRSAKPIKPVKRLPRCPCTINYTSVDFLEDSIAYFESVEYDPCPVCGYHKFGFVRGDLKWNLKHNLQKWAQPYTTYRRQQDANGERTTTDA